MVCDPKSFKDYPDLKRGDIVKFRSNIWGNGTGTVRLIWHGCAEMCDVQRHEDQRQIALCRELGDVIEKLVV